MDNYKNNCKDIIDDMIDIFNYYCNKLNIKPNGEDKILNFDTLKENMEINNRSKHTRNINSIDTIMHDVHDIDDIDHNKIRKSCDIECVHVVIDINEDKHCLDANIDNINRGIFCDITDKICDIANCNTFDNILEFFTDVKNMLHDLIL
jgi:hypothetical protein